MNYKNTKRIKIYQLGFSTIEILIAFSVGIIFLTAAIMVAFSDPSLRRQVSLNSNHALVLDATLDNQALATSSNRIGRVIAALTGNWKATADANSDTQYTTTPTITDISPCIKEITNSTTWGTMGDRARNITFGTILGDVESAANLGRGGCSPIPPSDWENPESDNLAQTNVSGAEGGTDISVRSFDGTRYAFITSNPQGAGTNKIEFTVVDVSDNNVENTDVIATLASDKGLLGVTVVGNYAYVLNNDSTNQLQIIDVSNPTTPTKLTTSYTLPNITCNYHQQNCQRIGRSLAYYDGYIYVGTGYMVGNSPEFHIYCVNDTSVAGCAPSTPVFRGSLDLDHNVNGIAVKGPYAYLATSADYAELTVIDVTNKVTPLAPPNYTTTGTNNRKFNALTTTGNASTEDAWSVYVLGNYAYLGREKVNNQNEREFYVLNIASSTAITAVGAVSFGMTNNGARISGIVVQGKTAFLSTFDSNRSLYVADISVPSAPGLRNSCSDFDTSQWTSAIEFKDNQAYLVHNQGSTLLKIIYDQGNVCAP